MNVDKYNVFVRVAEMKNLTKAAKSLGYSQSAVSHIIKNLEEDLGIKLIQRDRSGITLTKLGDLLYPDFKSIVTYEQALYHKVALLTNGAVGEINIGSFSSTSLRLMPHILKNMKKQYPNIEVHQTHDTYRGIEDMLKSGRIDCGFMTEMHYENLDFIPLMKDEFLVVLPPDHRLSKYERIPIEALEGEDFILMYEGADTYDTQNIISGINVKIKHSVEEDFVALSLVEAGMGFSILPRLIIDCVSTNAVIKSFAIPRYRSIGLAVKSLEEANPLTKIFISFAQDYVKTYSEHNCDKALIVSNL